MDSFEVRREYLRQGGSYRLTAAALTERGERTSYQNVQQHVARANRLQPLVVPAVTIKADAGVSAEDVEAIAAFVRASLDQAGITRNHST